MDCTGRNSNGVPRSRNSGLLREIVSASGVANQMKSWALFLVQVQAVQSTVVVNKESEGYMPDVGEV